MAIYTLHEGLLDNIKDMYKRKALEDEEVRKAKEMIKQHNAEKRARQKSRQTSTPAKNNENKPAFSKEQHDQALELFINLLKKHFPKIIALAKKELNKHPAWKQHCKYATLDFDDIYIADSKFYFNILELDLWDAYPEEARTVAHMDHPESEGFFKAFERSDAVINAYFATNDLPFKLEPTGDWDDIAEGIAVSIATLVRLASVQESTIFDNVTFLDEGAAALAAFIGLSSVLIFEPIISKKIDQMSIKLAFKSYANKNKDVKNLHKQIKSVSKININKLISSVNMNEDNIRVIKSKAITAYAIYDKNNNIVAYALFTRSSNNYVFDICDNRYGNSKELKTYIKALFEFEANVYGSGLKELLNTDADHRVGMGKIYKDKDEPDSLNISRQEYSEICSKMTDISNKLVTVAKSCISKYSEYYSDPNVGTSDNFKTNTRNKFTPAIGCEILSDLDNNTYVEDDTVYNIADKFEQALEGMGFDTYSDTEDSTYIGVFDNKKYPGIDISVDIDFHLNIWYQVKYARPIVIK